MNKLWKLMNKTWTSHEQNMNKSWASHDYELVISCTPIYYPCGWVGRWVDGFKSAVILRPSLAGVGAVAELGRD